jgi:hypothetical protein
MFVRNTFRVLALLAAAAGCQNEVGETPQGPDAPVTGSPDGLSEAAEAAPGSGAVSVGDVKRLPRAAIAAQPNPETAVEIVRRTTDGELVRAQVPKLAPTREVGAGSPCGVTDGTGTLLSCQAGSFCTETAPGAPATCVRAPAAPVWDR